MKAKVFALLLTGMFFRAYGQGEINFANTSTTLISANNSNTPIYQSSGSYIFALFSAPSGTPWSNIPWTGNNGWAFTGNYARNNGFNPGRISAFTNVNIDLSVSIPGYAAGSTPELLVIGWEAAYGGSTLQSFINNAPFDQYENVLFSGLYGVSAVANVTLGDGTGSVPNLFGTGPGQIQGFTLAYDVLPFPEPSTFSLISLGSAIFFSFRANKRR